MYLHPTYAVTPEREPLGILDAWMWARQAKGSDGTRPGIPESQRWIEGYERLAETAATMPDTRMRLLVTFALPTGPRNTQIPKAEP